MLDRLSSWRKARALAIEALSRQSEAGGQGDSLQAASDAIGSLDLPVDDPVRSYGELLAAVGMAARWQPARLGAEPDADRYRTAAAARAEAVLSSRTGLRADLREIAELLTELSDPAQVQQITDRMRPIALPPPITEMRRSIPPRSPGDQAAEEQVGPVLILAAIDGEPAPDPVVLRPARYYSLDLSARPTAWPTGTSRLKVEFLTALPPSVVDVGVVEFQKDALDGSTHLVLRADLGFERPAVELVLRATFLDDTSATPGRVIGYRRLRVTSFDAGSALPRDMPIVAARVQEMLAELDTSIPKLEPNDRQDLLTLLESLVRFAHREQQKALKAGDDHVDEATFQVRLEDHFAADPNIGARLIRRAAAATGLTDLGLGRVPLELKVEHDDPPQLEDAAKYMSQPEHYAADRDSQISVLAILDDSPKYAPPGVLSNYIGWMRPKLHGLTNPRFPSLVAVVIIPTRFPTPSTWSS